jgi:NAD(P)-dependent dehydrogenase (short-subunit alcohol dehydrogenase family)
LAFSIGRSDVCETQKRIGIQVNLQIDGKRALISGATSGIGLAIATTLADEGAAVIIAGRSKEKLERARQSVQSSSGKKAEVVTVTADLGTVEGVETVISSVSDIDILVNNLGIYQAKSFFELQDSDWMQIFEINVMSGVRLARHYLRGMLERNFGRIIFISSESGIMTPPEMIHYGLTKSAQLAVARGLAELTKGTKVTVNSILPGPTMSEGTVDFLGSISSKAEPSLAEAEKEFFEKHRSSSLLQRLIDPREIANLAAFIASPLSSATNGAALRAEGGLVRTIY